MPSSIIALLPKTYLWDSHLASTVDVGTNGGTAWMMPSTPPTPSATALITSYAYNDMGLVQDVTDPQGIVNRTLYDNLGRTTKTIQNYTDGTETAESNITTEYGYDGNNNVLYVQADQPGGSYQKTAYVYGVTTTGGSGVNSNDILSAVQHPDPTTGNPSSSQQDSQLVDALGEVTQTTDRNGNVHQFSRDILGRLTSDAVTTLGAGVDGSVRRLQFSYDTQGNAYLATSYDAATAGNIVNQVQRTFNGLGQLTGEYQSHSGAVVTGTTPEVQYAYAEMAGGQNNSRLVSMTYPSGYILNFNYDAGLDSNISRLSSISDTSNTLESYKYLGLDTVVERDHPQNNVNLTYLKQGSDPNASNDGGDQYSGLDRFGRVIDQNWVNATTGQSTDRLQMGYNPDGDVLYKQNLVDAVMSELYGYDDLHQLTSFQRGALNATHDGIVGTPSRSQSWSPDALGNFTSVTTDGSTQTRTHNQQNEITGISGAGAVTNDANGNTTADGSGNTFVYDAWNHLVAVDNGSTTLAAYGYDALGRRITETHGSTTTDLYLSSANQVLEERVGGVVQARNVWSPVYVNALDLRDQSSQHDGVLDQRLYAQQDANWNVTAFTDSSGNVVERYVDDAFGMVTVLNPDGTLRGTSAITVPYMWQGMRYDDSVNLYHTFTRDVSPMLMRPLQVDFAGLWPDNDPYRWEGNGPADRLDPSGLDYFWYGAGDYGTKGFYFTRSYNFLFWKDNWSIRLGYEIEIKGQTFIVYDGYRVPKDKVEKELSENWEEWKNNRSKHSEWFKASHEIDVISNVAGGWKQEFDRDLAGTVKECQKWGMDTVKDTYISGPLMAAGLPAVGAISRTLSTAFGEAKYMAGIGRSAQPTRQWTIRGSHADFPSGAGVRHPRVTHHGRIYEFEIVGNGGQKQYRYIIVHNADLTHGGIGHVHVGISKRGPTYRLNPGESYRNMDGTFSSGRPIPFQTR
jgi:YD repeat-containing protein